MITILRVRLITSISLENIFLSGDANTCSDSQKERPNFEGVRNSILPFPPNRISSYGQREEKYYIVRGKQIVLRECLIFSKVSFQTECNVDQIMQTT